MAGMTAPVHDTYGGVTMSNKLKKAALSGLAAAAATSGMLLGGAGIAGANEQDKNPEVFYQPHPGGLTATVKNWSNNDTHCTYVADGWIIRQVNLGPRGLPSDSQPLEFPGVPMFHPWDVSVTCDNNRSVHFVYWY
jgi:hypothetical protein